MQFEVADSKHQSNSVTQEKLSATTHSDAKHSDIETPETQPKIARLPSKRINSKQEMAPAIRGDRVRGSNKRLLSDKVSLPNLQHFFK